MALSVLEILSGNRANREIRDASIYSRIDGLLRSSDHAEWINTSNSVEDERQPNAKNFFQPHVSLSPNQSPVVNLGTASVNETARADANTYAAPVNPTNPEAKPFITNETTNTNSPDSVHDIIELRQRIDGLHAENGPAPELEQRIGDA